MILVDASVWIDHFRSRNSSLVTLLELGEVVTHTFVVGELAAGSLRNRSRTIENLKALPTLALAQHSEVMNFVESQKLWNRGLSWIDLHLLAAARLAGMRLWTLDQSLKLVAASLPVIFSV
ncbi:MAG: PIN domain-containing protein [Candidatus Eremiobacteraeota bacterium]|nr:PIN domain-containing protein [Candidatus Eremiobacteraeota bacterium]